MGRTIVWDGTVEGGEEQPDHPRGRGWRAFLQSWKWAAILVAACVVGLAAIYSAHPFGSPSVSERVSARVGQPASCTEVGATQVAGESSKIYKCTVGVGTTRRGFQCFAVSGGDIKQLSGNRKLGC